MSSLIITGIIDGPLSGGLPKAVELYVVADLPDLSEYSLGTANNGGGSDGEEFAFPSISLTAGTYIYVATETPGFTTFFGFAPNYTTAAVSINGNDAIELFWNGAVVDVFGEISVDGTGEPWEYTDGWAYRDSGTGPDGTTFTLSNWTFSGIDALDGISSNASAATPFPTRSFSTAPAIATLTPTDNANNVVVSNNLQITFNENIQKGTGNIVIKQSSDNAVVESFDVTTSAQVTVIGSTVTINPTNDLIAGTGYYVEIISGAIEDLAGNDFAGITSATTWNFTTAAAVNPTVNLSVSANAGTEAGTTVITVTATASSAVSGIQTVNVAVTGTGITAGDYNLSNSTITIPNSATTGSVTFTVVDDALVEGTETATLTISNPSAGITLGATTTQNITITDNDTAGATIVQSSGSTDLTEGGATDTYTIVLNSQPTANVTIAIAPDSQSTTNPTSLTFTSANWNVDQTVTVTAVNDSVVEGNHTSTIQHTATSSDTNYNGLTIGSVTASITDNDTAGVTIVQTGGTALTEGGATDTYTIVLNSQPTANVAIALDGGPQLSTNSLIFTTTNWNTPQTVTLTATNDTIGEGTHQGVITSTVTSTDTGFNGLSVAPIQVTITDNDLPTTPRIYAAMKMIRT